MKKNLFSLLLVSATTLSLAACGGNNEKPDDSTTAGIVQIASGMTIAELEEASRKEMEASNDTFKVLGLTSTLKTALNAFAKKYDWIKYSKDEEVAGCNVYVKNDYKDYTLLEALSVADDKYVADFALTQDARSIADYAEEGILLNYVPSDYASYGLSEKSTKPLQGIHFNKIFWTNTNFETVTGKKLYNIWQLAGSSEDADHLSKVSFQTPATEQINMSFLLSVQAPENQDRIKSAYKSYYGKDWASDKFTSAGEQWVNEFVKNISRWHGSDGTAMKETQLKDDWREGYVYFGAYSKMKDAAGKYYAVEGQDSDPILAPLVEKEGDNAGKVNAMATVKWDWEIEGFNGFFYTMYSQVVNNAKHPYTACLYARYLLEPEMYAAMCHSSKTPNSDGSKGNQYGYYYPGNAATYTSGDTQINIENDQDWKKSKWIERSIIEDYTFLKDVKSSQVAKILSLIS